MPPPPSALIEDQVAFRHQARYVARLSRLPVIDESAPVRLAMTSRGTLDALRLEPVKRRPPAAHEVEIRVHATGLNFRDVLNVLGMYPGDPGPAGNECAGEIVAAGAAVEGFAAGDAVIALVDDGFSHYVTVSADRLVHKPQDMSFAEAATIPIAFLTAAHCLEHVARIQPGERVLIHTATGGFGQAAIQLAQHAKATIFATAGRDKWKTLRDLGVEHIYDSRTLDFADGVLADTGGKGVDIIVNTLTGPGYIEKNLSILSPHGRFVEVSKRDVWDAARVAGLRPDVAYALVDLADMTAKQPRVVQGMLQGLMPRFRDGTLRPLPRTPFPLRDVAAAFRYMAQARHTGKIVVVSEPRQMRLSENATYLITGGLGGLGLLMARWLVQHGARHLMLMGRSAPRPDARQQLDELQQMGAVVTVVEADVADAGQAAGALGSIDQAHPLRGIIHAAGVLDDGAIVNQDMTRFARVLAPKVQGGWNLHALTAGAPLDFFVLFSSVASLLGAAGQSNHAAANAFMDALAHYRRGLGLPALSINWGAWSEVGVAAPLVPRIQRQGLGSISPQQGQQVFEHLVAASSAQAGVIPVDWARYRSDSAFLSDFRQSAAQREEPSPFIHELRAAPDNRQRQLLTRHVQAQVAQILGHHDSSAISISHGFRELGMDSLTSLELRNRLQASLDCQLPVGLVFNHPTIDAVAEYLAGHVLASRAVTAPLPQAASPAAAAPPMRERRQEGQGLSLCLCDWGSGASPIVCLHGTRDHAGSWESVAALLAAEGYAVMAPDLRGHGRSDHLGRYGTYHVRDFVGDLDAILRQPGLARVPLVAHSLGSLIAVLFAAARPERIHSLVLVEPPLPPENHDAPGFAAHIAAQVSSPDVLPQHPLMADLNVAIERLQQVTPTMPHAMAQRMAQRLTARRNGGVVWNWDARLDGPHERLLAGLARQEYLGMLAALPVPVTVVYGAASGWIRQAEKDLIQAALPDVRPVVLNGGHNLHVEAAAELAAVIKQAVAAVDDRRQARFAAS